MSVVKTGKAACGLALGLAVMTGACSKPPVLTGLLPGRGYPRQLLAVDGTTALATVVWDAGLPSEAVLPSGLFGTRYFQIPSGAAPGPHPVAIRNDAGTSASVTVQVLAFPSLPAPAFPSPRIEDVGVLGVAGAAKKDVVITVSAANLDVNAEVSVEEVVDETAEPRNVRITVPWGGLPIDYLQAHDPATFGYAVYHYAQVVSVVEGVALGSPLRITVKNTDGLTDTTTYLLPDSEAALDGDGDGLLDVWEDGEYTAPSGNKVALAAMGTKKWRKDVLIETDWVPAAMPAADVWTLVADVFETAPVLNPDGSSGVNVIVDHGQGGEFTGGEALPTSDCLTLEDPAPALPAGSGCTTLTSFYDYKRANFNADRKRIFHYMVWGNRHVSSVSGDGERYGNDFIVTVASSGGGTSVLKQFSTFVHELGHNLGFSHGDLVTEDQNFILKPNLPSVMNYRYQLTGIDLDCNLKGDGVFTYSQGTLASLNEADVDETKGVCDNVPVDLNMPPDGTFTKGPMNLNPNPLPDGDTDNVDQWDDFDQWGSLRLDFTSSESNWNDD